MKKNTLIFITFILILSTLLSGCQANKRSEYRSDGMMMAAPAYPRSGPSAGNYFDIEYADESAMDYMVVATQAPYAQSASSDEYAAKNAPATPRMIVKNGDLTIEVEDPALAVDKIGQIAATYNGFVVSSMLNKDYSGRPAGTISIRVDAVNFEKALAEIENLVPDADKNISNKVVTGDDITDQYVDTESKLKSLEAKKAKLEEILDRTKSVKDTLEVYQEVAAVNEEIEIVKGRMIYMEQSARLSSISVDVKSIPEEIQILNKTWTPNTAFRRALQSFVETGQDFIDWFIYFVIATLPFLLLTLAPFALIIWLIVRKVRKNRKNKTVQSDAASTENTPSWHEDENDSDQIRFDK